MSQVLVAVAVHDGVEDGAGHPDQVAADVDGDHRLAVHALRKSNVVNYQTDTYFIMLAIP